MIGEPTKSTDDDARCEPRTSVFVMATLYAGAGSSAVKVRDVSPAGALIEGGVVPPPGTQVCLCRAGLTITGTIVWSRGDRAGLRFESRTSVAEWLPRGGALAPQQRVDEIVQQVKASGPARPLSRRDVPTFQSATISDVELTQLALALESLAEDLAGDAGVTTRHMEKLQTLDVAVQALRKLAAER